MRLSSSFGMPAASIACRRGNSPWMLTSRRGIKASRGRKRDVGCETTSRSSERKVVTDPHTSMQEPGQGGGVAARLRFKVSLVAAPCRRLLPSSLWRTARGRYAGGIGSFPTSPMPWTRGRSSTGRPGPRHLFVSVAAVVVVACLPRRTVQLVLPTSDFRPKLRKKKRMTDTLTPERSIRYLVKYSPSQSTFERISYDSSSRDTE
jgi:hypothetical protein